MAGTRAGGLKASITNKEKHGSDFYARIGRIGGQNGHTGGFASNIELAREAGRKGGKISKRGKSTKTRSDKGKSRARKVVEPVQESKKRKFGWLFGRNEK